MAEKELHLHRNPDSSEKRTALAAEKAAGRAVFGVMRVEEVLHRSLAVCTGVVEVDSFRCWLVWTVQPLKGQQICLT